MLGVDPIEGTRRCADLATKRRNQASLLPILVLSQPHDEAAKESDRLSGRSRPRDSPLTISTKVFQPPEDAQETSAVGAQFV